MAIAKEQQSPANNLSVPFEDAIVYVEGPVLSLSALLGILWAGRSLILLVTGVLTILSLTYALILPLTYTATASFLPPGSNMTPSASALMGQLSTLGGGLFGGGKSQGDLYVGILKSHTIRYEMVKRFGLKEIYKAKLETNAEGNLLGHSLFEVGSKDPIVTISVTEHDPKLARDLANGYLQVLQDVTADLAVTESSQRRLFFERRLTQEKNELASAEIALKQSQEKSGLIAPAGQTAQEIQSLATLRAQVTARQVQLASLLHDETEENPDVIRLRSEVSNLQDQAAAMENGQMKGRFGVFSTAQVPGLELEYIRLMRDVKYHEALFDIIAKQYEAARMDEARDSPLQVLDRATVPEIKSGPHRSLIVAVGILLGFLSSVAYVIVRALRLSGPLDPQIG